MGGAFLSYCPRVRALQTDTDTKIYLCVYCDSFPSMVSGKSAGAGHAEQGTRGSGVFLPE